MTPAAWPGAVRLRSGGGELRVSLVMLPPGLRRLDAGSQ